LEKIAEVARRHNLLVMTDEIYSELTFEGEHTSIASLPGMKERTIFLHGFSKAYAMTGFRIGYACGPAEMIEAMMRIHQYSMLCASIISQEAALEAIQHGEADTVEMREQYRVRRNFIVNAFNRNGPALPSAARLLLRLSLHPLHRAGFQGIRRCNCWKRESRLRSRQRLRPQRRRLSALLFRHRAGPHRGGTQWSILRRWHRPPVPAHRPDI
jgi:histidinol-phosphate/aromatic aminotransferase/cobyric acid decarboxylase-like protein